MELFNFENYWTIPITSIVVISHYNFSYKSPFEKLQAFFIICATDST